MEQEFRLCHGLFDWLVDINFTHEDFENFKISRKSTDTAKDGTIQKRIIRFNIADNSTGRRDIGSCMRWCVRAFFSHPAFARRPRIYQMRASIEEDLEFQREESEDTIQSSLSLEDDLNEADHAVAKALAALARDSRPAPLLGLYRGQLGRQTYAFIAFVRAHTPCA